MAGSVNRVTILGCLGRDPEVRSFPNGGKVCNLSIATSQTWRDKASGEKKERTEWHKVAILNEALVGVAEKYLRKGSTRRQSRGAYMQKNDNPILRGDPMTVSDAALLREYDERREGTGWPHEACVDAVAENHGMTPAHAADIADRLRHLLARRVAPMGG